MFNKLISFAFLAILSGFIITFMGFGFMSDANAESATKRTKINLDLVDGRVVIETRPDLAPNHVKQITKLVKDGFYNKIIFHRVIDGFMAQTGDPTGTGMGGSKEPDLKAEFSNETFTRGTVGMARSSNPNSANSQFFICFEDCSFLDGQYTIWGKVVEGMTYVDMIAQGEPPAEPDSIIRMSMADDSTSEQAAE